ncbi:hypothetical protein CAPTEDRAFT_204612 [Capitella teleta]|uniref:Uncharacterized protein n=1 Tax=Capitella teleta TaxID=283909 RepID=R7USW8_CAPTE|nr:hypothetical protein CAPTEDRAFT_204612 [Capitella teleta]|eukprot:ELU07007.1 hypothetical protein CAPTEDRAFT_204612 [Capitella teleta]
MRPQRPLVYDMLKGYGMRDSTLMISPKRMKGSKSRIKSIDKRLAKMLRITYTKWYCSCTISTGVTISEAPPKSFFAVHGRMGSTDPGQDPNSHPQHNLKMKLTLTQNSSVQLPTNIFATHLPINMSATVLENSTDVTYLYRWWRNDRPVTKFTEQCYYVTTFSDARPKFVGVEIKMAKSETDPLTNSTTVIILQDLNNSPIPAGIPILCASIALAFFCLFFIAYKKDLLSETNVETASFSLPESRAFFFEKASRRFNAMKDGLRRAYHSIQERYEAMKTKESTTPVVYRMSSPASYGTLEDSLTNSVHFEC